MNADRIDFISSYCDRWCERCAYTSRCSAYAVEIATAMCGDFAQGLELAVGSPQPPDREARVESPEWLAELQDFRISPKEEAEFERNESARRARASWLRARGCSSPSAARRARCG